MTHKNILYNSDIHKANLITGSDHNIITTTLDTHTIIRNHKTTKKGKRQKKRRIYQYNKMNDKLWERYKHKLNHLLTHYKIVDSIAALEEQQMITREDLTHTWANIAKCFQRTANQTILSIIVNEDTTLSQHVHGKLRD